MPNILEQVDNIILDKDNKRFFEAVELVENTSKNIYLTGKAGTGKTTFLKYLRRVSKKQMAILAPTGLAAVNAGGQTIHSFFKIPPSEIFLPGDPRLDEHNSNGMNIYQMFSYSDSRRSVIRALDLIIIDEVSMVRCEMLDLIDRLLQVYRGRKDIPFGGVQMIFVGDLFQLPPIVKGQEYEIISQSYSSPFFFSAKVLEKYPPIYIELEKIYRQNEQEFIGILNRIRIGAQTQEDINDLNRRQKDAMSCADSNYITLCTTNTPANEENNRRLNDIDAPSKQYRAHIKDTFPESRIPAPLCLELKIGAQVVLLKNGVNYYNGSIGTIVSLEENTIGVALKNGKDETIHVTIERATWDNIEYVTQRTVDEYGKAHIQVESKILGSYTQFPIKLGWAITVHKSQGQTFDNVIADIADAFAEGQVYVALSRCTHLNGLVLKRPITMNAIKVAPQVVNFAQKITPQTLIEETIVTGKADTLYRKARECAKCGKPEDCIDSMLKARNYRDDFSTDLFRRFFCVWYNKFFNRYIKFPSLLSELLNKSCQSWNWKMSH